MSKVLYPLKKATRNNKFISQTYYEGSSFYPAHYGTASHAAIDIQSDHGNELVACEDFNPYKVFSGATRDTITGISKGWGFNALTAPDANGICREYVYWHCMSNVVCKQGVPVARGDITAYEGDSGDVYSNGIKVPDSAKGKFPFPGTHLHWAYREVKMVMEGENCLVGMDGKAYRNPDNGMVYDVQNYDNGNKGFLDPMLLDIVYYDEWVKEREDAARVLANTVEIGTTVNNILPKLDEQDAQTLVIDFSRFIQSIINWWNKGRSS